MSSSVIEELVEILCRELEKEDIQSIINDPRKRVNEILEKIEEKLKKDPSTDKKDALMEESKFLRRLLKSIEDIRFEKIYRDVLREKKSKNMMEREILTYQNLTRSIGGREQEKEKILIVVQERIPAFIGVNGQERGPFEPGDVVSIHMEDFRTLAKEELVKKVEIEK